jgi:hypothetical protein
MTFSKAGIDRAKAELEELRAAIQNDRIANGGLMITIINDPEDEKALAEHRNDDLDQGQAVQVGLAEFPGLLWYSEYQRASREGDKDYARDLSRRGAQAIRPEAREQAKEKAP